MKNLKRNSILMILTLLIVLYFILKDDFSNIVNTLSKVNPAWIIVSIISIIIYWLFKALGLFILVKEQSKKIKFKTIFKQGIITEFFNAITPFSTGGQPMQVYMLNKTGISVANSTNMIVQSFLFFQTALLVHGIIAVILNYQFNLVTVNSTLWTLIMLGFIINTVVGIGLLFISFSTKFNNMVGKLIIKIGVRFKIVKNKDKTTQKWQEKLEEYHNNAELLRKKKSLFIKGFLYNFIGLIFLYITPLFVVYSMGLYNNISMLAAIVTSAFVLIIGNFVPIPGGSGGIEYGFLNLFNVFLSGPILPAVLIIWRFVTYYLGMIVGGITLIFFKGEDKK